MLKNNMGLEKFHVDSHFSVLIVYSCFYVFFITQGFFLFEKEPQVKCHASSVHCHKCQPSDWGLMLSIPASASSVSLRRFWRNPYRTTACCLQETDCLFMEKAYFFSSHSQGKHNSCRVRCLLFPMSLLTCFGLSLGFDGTRSSRDLKLTAVSHRWS